MIEEIEKLKKRIKELEGELNKEPYSYTCIYGVAKIGDCVDRKKLAEKWKIYRHCKGTPLKVKYTKKDYTLLLDNNGNIADINLFITNPWEMYLIDNEAYID